jgi:hypothetical protein
MQTARQTEYREKCWRIAASHPERNVRISYDPATFAQPIQAMP